MRAPNASQRLSLIALVILGLLAAVLSVAALLSTRPVTPAQEPTGLGTTTPAIATETPDPEPTEDEAEEPEATPTSEPTTPEAEETTEPPTALSVVVIGDSHSLGDEGETWVDAAAEELGWGSVTNLASPGRGFFASPRACDFTPL